MMLNASGGYKATDLPSPKSSKAAHHASATNFGGRDNLQPACSAGSPPMFHSLSPPHPQPNSSPLLHPPNFVDEITNPLAWRLLSSIPSHPPLFPLLIHMFEPSSACI